MKEKVFYVVNKTETERQGGRDVFYIFENLGDPLEPALPEVLTLFASSEQMNEGFFWFLAKGAAICLFDTYFVQKVICGYFSKKEFKLECSKLSLSSTQR